MDKIERCAICNCGLHRTRNTYARPTIEGRSHATEHHYVAERFFGRSTNRSDGVRARIFVECPWGVEGSTAVFCYECHEELLHNPVLLASDIERFARLVKDRGFAEDQKTESRTTHLGRLLSAGFRAAEGGLPLE